MKVLCISDTHMENDIFQNITNQYPNMDCYIHCGDSSLSCEDILLARYIVVKGNHDEKIFPKEEILEVEGYKVLVIHGNDHQVYTGYTYLLQYMEERNIDICFHGHTHIPTVYRHDHKIIINPGSTMMNRGSYGFGTFAIVSIEKQRVTVNFYHHTTFQECSEWVISDGKNTLKMFRELLPK